MSDIYRLEPEQLRQLRDAAAEEIITGIRRGADVAALRDFVQVVDQCDRRIDAQAARPATVQRRQQLAARGATSRRGGRMPGDATAG